MELRTKPLYRIGHRPQLMLGGERAVVLFFGVIGGSLVVQGVTITSKALGVSMWLFGLWWARSMAKIDPQWLRVWQRRRQYAGVYLARATPFRKNNARQGQRYGS